MKIFDDSLENHKYDVGYKETGYLSEGQGRSSAVAELELVKTKAHRMSQKRTLYQYKDGKYRVEVVEEGHI